MSVLATGQTSEHTVLTFLEPPPGLAPLAQFTLSAVEGSAELFTLTSVASAATRLFLLDPEPFFPGYRPQPDEQILTQLGSGEIRALVVITPETDTSPHTANLLAPVLINTATGKAVQTVLENGDWPLRVPLQTASA